MKLRILPIILALFAALDLSAQDDHLRYFESMDVRTEYQNTTRPIWTDDWTDVDADVDENGIPPANARVKKFVNDPRFGNMEFHYLGNRKALTGVNCVLNKYVRSVGVASWSTDLGALLNDDLDDYAEFAGVAELGLTANPMLGIRDLKNYYAKGTKAGFCIVAGSGSGVLALNVIKAYSIGFYRDGKLVGSKAVEEGADGAGVALKLIQIPGSDDAVIMMTATSDWLFDEITFDRSGGLEVSAGDIMRIKYAFVGEATEYRITHSGITKYNATVGLENPLDEQATHDNLKGYNPVLLGIPFPLVDSEVDKMWNEKDDDYAAMTPIIAIGYQGGAKFIAQTVADQGEAFPAGYEVGFKYKFGSALDLDIGGTLNVRLFDRDGNIIQTENISTTVLGLTIGSGGDGTVNITAAQPFSGAELRFLTGVSVKLGAIGVHYAFVKAKPDINHSCPINPSVSGDICDDLAGFQLRSNPDVSVTWIVEEAPYENNILELTPGGKVTGLNGAKGRYVFRAVAADGCYEDVVLNVGAIDDRKLDNKEAPAAFPLVNYSTAEETNVFGTYEVRTSPPDGESSGSLVSISNVENQEDIVSSDVDAYGTYTGGLSVADNLMIVGIRRTDGLIYDGSDRHADETPEQALNRAKPRRVGFVAAMETQGLDLSLLQLMQIRCYKDGEEVYRSVIEEAAAISAGIAGSTTVNKSRFSIVVPGDEENLQFDEIALWNSGVLNLKIDKVDIFYPFIESADPMDNGYQLMSWNNTSTTYDTDNTTIAGAIEVASVTDNLGFLVDDDLETALVIERTVSLGDGMTLAVDMGRTMDHRQQVSIVVNEATYLAGVEAGGWMTVETYYNGEPTGDKFTDWNAVGANVAGYQSRSFLPITPTHQYDEIRMTFGQIAGVLSNQEYYGIAWRPDADGDGTPDYLDPCSCDNVLTPELTVDPVCAGMDPLHIHGQGVMVEDVYTLRSNEPGRAEVRLECGFSSTAIDVTLPEIPTRPGEYQFIVYDKDGKRLCALDYTVHPRETTWRTDNIDSEWNKWDNWTNGSPYCCTNVIIPSDAKVYPVLGMDPGDKDFCCDGILFEPRASVQNIMSLTYTDAWADVALKANRYYNLVSPFKGMPTGDWFINYSAELKNFELLTAENYPASRFDPSVYQRLWRSVPAEPLEIGLHASERATIAVSKWTREFNAVGYVYPFATGFSLWVDNGARPDSETFTFRIPKSHTSYDYYNDWTHGALNGTAETIARGEHNRFIFEGEDPSEGITLTASEPTGTFLMGNPYMSRLAISRFLTANPDVAAMRVVSDGKEITVTPGVSTAALLWIEPLQSVFLDLASGVTATELTVVITPDMIAGEVAEAFPMLAPALQIAVATPSGARSTMALVDGEAAASETVFDSEADPEVKVFAMNADGRAYDILAIPADADVVPLGIFMAPGAEGASLSFRTVNRFARGEYEIVDRLGGRVYSLDETIELGAGSSAGRYALRRAGAETPVIDGNAPSATLSVDGRRVVATASTPCIVAVEAHDAAGRLVAASRRSAPTASATLLLPPGLHLVTLRLSNAPSRTYKLLLH